MTGDDSSLQPERDDSPSEAETTTRPSRRWFTMLGAALALLVALVIYEGSKPRLVTGLMVEDPLAGISVAPITSSSHFSVEFLRDVLKEPGLRADLGEALGQDVEVWRIFRHSTNFGGSVTRLTRAGEEWTLIDRSSYDHSHQQFEYSIRISPEEARQFRDRLEASIDRVTRCPRFHGQPEAMCCMSSSVINLTRVSNGQLSRTEIFDNSDCKDCFRFAKRAQWQTWRPLSARIADGRCRLTRTRWHFDPELAKRSILGRLGLWP